MKKYRLESSKECAICLESITEGILLHKTQRQTHKLCLDCGEAYLLSKLNENFEEKKYVHTITCSGTFNGQKRNSCKKELDVTQLKIPDSIESIHILIAKITAFTMPGATCCLSGVCNNVILVPEGIDIINCDACQLTWCRKCNVSPYHTKMSCNQYKIMNDNSTEGQYIKKMIEEGKIKLCKGCNHAIERNQGCNKMTCSKCKTTMCWICSESGIDYSHFSSGPCSQKLWNT